MDPILKPHPPSPLIGAKCVELSVKELQASIEELLKKYPSGKSVGNFFSSQYPNITFEGVDINTVIMHSKETNEEGRYFQMQQLLLDRVHFLSLIMSQLLSSAAEESSKNSEMGQGDNATILSCSYKVKGLSLTPNCETTPSLVAVLEKILASLPIFLKPHWRSVKTLSLKERHQTQHNASTQSENTSAITCETCFVVQYILKFIARIAETCFENLHLTDACEIQAYRKDLRKTVWKISQRAAVSKWCSAIQNDFKKVAIQSEKLLRENKELKEERSRIKGKLEKEGKRQNELMEEFQKSLKLAEEAIQAERADRKKTYDENEKMAQQIKDLEETIKSKVDDIEDWQKKCNEAENSLEKTKKLHQDLHTNYKNLKKANEKLDKDLNDEKSAKERFEAQLNTAKGELDSQNNTIWKLRKELGNYENEKKQKAEMINVLEAAKEKLRVLEKSEAEQKALAIKYQVKVQELENSLKSQASKIETLTLYPDLNGAVNPPAADEVDPVAAMENQVVSNNLRIEVLQKQTERLSSTLSKLKEHFKKM